MEIDREHFSDDDDSPMVSCGADCVVVVCAHCEGTRRRFICAAVMLKELPKTDNKIILIVPSPTFPENFSTFHKCSVPSRVDIPLAV